MIDRNFNENLLLGRVTQDKFYGCIKLLATDLVEIKFRIPEIISLGFIAVV